MKTKYTRKFLGKTEGFESKEERRFEQRHLHHYLKGNKRFKYGVDADGFPKYYDVKQELTVIKR